MNTIYKWTDASEHFIFKINGDIRTTFRVASNGLEQEQYLAWLAEGNEPLPADKS